MDIYTDPDFARSLFDRVVEELLAPWILHLKKEFPNATSISGDDATGSLPIVNLEILQDWIVPYVMRLREICGPEEESAGDAGYKTAGVPGICGRSGSGC
jgi:hypothetical protein